MQGRRPGQPRQDHHLRAGLLALLRGAGRPAGPQPVGPRVHRRRLQRRRGGGRGGRAGAGRAGLRRRRLAAHPGRRCAAWSATSPAAGWSPAARSASARSACRPTGRSARTVADVAALLDVLAAPVPGEPYLPPAPPAGRLPRRRPRPPSPAGCASAASPRRCSPTSRSHPDCVAAVDRAAALLTAAGHEVVEVPAPLGPASWPLFEIVWYVLALAPVPPERESELLPLTRHLRARGAEISAGTPDRHPGRAPGAGTPRRPPYRRTATCCSAPPWPRRRRRSAGSPPTATRRTISTGNGASRRTAPSST